MLDDFSQTNRIKLQRDEDINRLEATRMNSSSDLFPYGLFSQSATSVSIDQPASSSVQTNSYQVLTNTLEQRELHFKQQQPNHYHHHNQQQTSSDEQYFTSDETNSSSHNMNTGSNSASSTTHIKTEIPNPRMLDNTDIGAVRHSAMVPTTAHCSDQHNLHYSLTNSKTISASSPSNMVLNFSQDLLLHQGQPSLHHDFGETGEHKSTQLELDSGNLIRFPDSAAAANMNIWKNTMNFGLKHSTMNEHGLIQSSDMNSFSNWSHGGTLNHQGPPGMTHQIIESHHLIGYPQSNQRSLHLNNHDLVGASLKNQVCAAEQASFMLNSINHSATSQAPISSHHNPHQPNDNSHLRPQSLDHAATSYNLSMNDGQFHNSRSHSSTIKSSVFLQDRSGPMCHSNNQSNHLSYHDTDHLNPQPTTSHHVAGTSAGSPAKNIGSFKCPHCNEMFNMRNLYQSHLKTHSQEKGSKAKFHCELCMHTFSQKTSLNRHMKSHTGERPFPCEVCGKAFSEKERLKIHMRTHTGEKPFSCVVCGKSFSQKSTVKRHQTVHTGEKKFKCDCGKGFANRGNLIAHIKTRGSHHFE